MKTPKIFTLFTLIILIVTSCKKDDSNNGGVLNLPPVTPGTIEVVINDIPYPTERFLRIGYTIKMWEYKKDGLELQEIIVLDDDTKNELMRLTQNTMPVIWENPLPPTPYFSWDEINHYYISIQLPILLAQNIPSNISHKLVFKRLPYNDIVNVEGGVFSPDMNQTPIAIASPVKGKHWIFGS